MIFLSTFVIILVSISVPAIRPGLSTAPRGGGGAEANGLLLQWDLNFIKEEYVYGKVRNGAGRRHHQQPLHPF